MIETYKILTGKYDVETAPSLVGVCFSVTRGHSLRLQKIGQNMIYVSFVLALLDSLFFLTHSLQCVIEPRHVISG